MDDLISRQEVIKILNKEGYTKNMRVHKEILSLPPYEMPMFDTESWKITVTDTPIVEYAPVKYGKWVYRGLGGWHCSLCDEQAPFWCMASTQNLSNYCQNCGAQMERSEDA